MRGEEGRNRMPVPLENIPFVAAPRTQDQTILAKDGVTRRMLISAYERVMLHPHIAQDFNPALQDLNHIRGQIELFDTKQAYIDFKPTHTYPELSFENFLNRHFRI
jgi:hypothetical protein